jgi:hypothetical protein
MRPHNSEQFGRLIQKSDMRGVPIKASLPPPQTLPPFRERASRLR